ncbi:periplasmic glucan biosynthesis protein MdoG [Rhodopirellula maiorica SM1]|uniref:Periplasmic glucan biosynthesis protein MdoG n=1 Tax=Rhodopirellula maiorica SM1 TaxID=1265738 RepID=M5RJ69_9BACT|nr:glucan biosynthesis protein [Rhodopirellula maiorica]EMI19330.1 periplasmic glucan biosynthesis protein MdoG [Rhodopirellula maiorica SM1]
MLRLFTALSLLLALFAGITPADSPRRPVNLSQSRQSAAATQITSFAELKALAAATAKNEFQPRAEPPTALSQMSYEQYRDIQYRPEKAVWWKDGLPFWLETFHRGFVQRDRVSLYTNEKGVSHEVPFSSRNFLYRTPIAEKVVRDSGHAGIKIAGRFPGQGDGQEMLTFLGSSYFRGRSADTVYGASARGLAVDIALNRDEEFPFFKSFWVQRPKPDDEQLSILALMDSRSVSGAYQFTLTPGTTETTVDVKCSLYFRSLPEKIGVAPLTSMWMWGDGLMGPPLDNRPAVHDSDGLLIQTENDGWTWRAFARQSYPSVSQFRVDKLAGFGVLQRNRAFYHFDDHNAQYHNRPSVWVRPKRGWENGVVELLELPGAHEGIDNIGVYWIPDQKPTLDTPLDLDYQVSFFPGDRSDQTEVARATYFDVQRQDGLIAMDIRFAGDVMARRSDGTVDVDVTTVRGEVISASADRTDTGDWIAHVLLRPTEDAPVELGVTLVDASTDAKQKLSERFVYLCPATEPTFEYPQVYTRKE